MEKFVNVENGWSDGIDASTVEGVVRSIQVEGCSVQNWKSKWALWGCKGNARGWWE